jgi:acetyl esterase
MRPIQDISPRSQHRFTLVASATAVVALVACAHAAHAAAPGAMAASAPADPAMNGNGTKYKSDRDMGKVLAALAGLGGKPIETLMPEEARKQPTATDAVMQVLKEKGKDTMPTKLVPGVTSVDSSIPGPAGNLPIRTYTPDGKGPFPVIVYYHGGGWVLADKNVYDAGARGLSKQAKAIVVSVDYRLAPEAKFPAQYDDSVATYKWVAANAASFNGDPKKLAVAGESAGGNLAVEVALAARDQKLTLPVGVVAVYPVVQLSDTSTPSYNDAANAKPLDKAMMGWFGDQVFAKPADKVDPRVDLLKADLKGLPPVTLINAQIDPLRSDGDMLAAALKSAGVKVDHKVYDGVTHEFFGMAAVVGDAKSAQEKAGGALEHEFRKAKD